MKSPNREIVSKLEELPNIMTPQSLIGKDAFELYDELCKKTDKNIDPCIIDVFMSVIDFMEGGEPKTWWEFTNKRKELLSTSKWL